MRCWHATNLLGFITLSSCLQAQRNRRAQATVTCFYSLPAVPPRSQGRLAQQDSFTGCCSWHPPARRCLVTRQPGCRMCWRDTWTAGATCLPACPLPCWQCCSPEAIVLAVLTVLLVEPASHGAPHLIAVNPGDVPAAGQVHPVGLIQLGTWQAGRQARRQAGSVTPCHRGKGITPGITHAYQLQTALTVQVACSAAGKPGPACSSNSYCQGSGQRLAQPKLGAL